MGVDGLGMGRRDGWQGEGGVCEVARAREVVCVVEMRRGPEWVGQLEDNRDEATRVRRRTDGIVSD